MMNRAEFVLEAMIHSRRASIQFHIAATAPLRRDSGDSRFIRNMNVLIVETLS